MSNDLGLPTDRDVTLEDLGAALDGDALCSAARAIESRRGARDEALLTEHHRLAIEGLTTTPFMYQAGLVARERGYFAFDRLERAFLPRADAWAHPEVAAGYGALTRGAERLVAPALWPFAQDCPVGDFQLNMAPKWWSHGLVHALVGFGWWPGLSEWELMHMTRLSEALASLHYYWLAELGRADTSGVGLDLAELTGTDLAIYAQLELDARDPEVRLARLDCEMARGIGDNAVQVLNYEQFAYRRGLFEGYLVEPTEKYLALGEAGDYAKVHLPRLISSSFARYREHCLVAGADYATSAEGFERRVADVLRALVTPRSPSESVAARRGLRVLQDLGQRVCHAAELAGAPTTVGEGALRVIADGIAALRDAAPETDPDAQIAAALEAVAADFPGGADGPDAGTLLALGYAPMVDGAREPAAARSARTEACVARGWRIGAVVGTALEAMRPAVRRLVAEPRRVDVVDEIRPAAEQAAANEELYFVAEGYAGWLELLKVYWGRTDGLGNTDNNWHYRLARRSLPEDEASWDQFVVMLNPYLNRLPLPFDARWNDELLRRPRGEVPNFKPRPPHGANYCLVGPGRSGPVYAPITPKLNGLMIKLKAPRRLDELAAMREMSAEIVARAIADEVVLCHHKPFHEQERLSFNLLEQLMEHADEFEQRLEPAGPWDDEEQAAAYVAFCERSSLYRDVSTALVEVVGVSDDARVAELGFGTGETSRVILARLGALGRLVAADPAPRMVEGIYGQVDDDRARFVLGASRALAQVAQFEGGFDRLVSNAALWLARDITDELRAARGVLAPGGRFGFSIPAEYLGDSAHLLSEEALTVSAAIERARAATGVRPPGTDDAASFGGDAALGDVDAMKAALEKAGFTDIRVDRYTRPWPASEYLDWVALPVVIGGMCAEADKPRAGELLDALRAEVPGDTPLETAWFLVTASAPG